jgi:homoserine O-acetyltransferase/O-succinyltransferase
MLPLSTPISCQPVEISGRNWLGRRAQAEAIRHDPDWNNGFYKTNPRVWNRAPDPMEFSVP